MSRLIGRVDGLPVVMLGPGDVEVLEQDSPGHRVDGEVVDDQHQLAGVGHPQRAEHRPGRRVQPRPRRGERLVGEHVDSVQASAGIDRSRLGHRQ